MRTTAALHLGIILLPALAAGPALAQDAGAARDDAGPPPVVVEYFYEEGCPVCRRVSREVLPRLDELFADLYVLQRRETGVEANRLDLIRYQEKLAIDENASAIMIVEGRYAFAGWNAISEGVAGRVEALIAQQLDGETGAPAPEPVAAPAPSEEEEEEDVRSLLARRLRRFTAVGVALGGLVDGVNPCAISTLVFFLSLLSVMKVRGARLIMVGLTFCAASFLTYTALGFGLLRALHLFSGFQALRTGAEAVMVLLLAFFALSSFRDAWRYRSTQDSRDVALKLPDGIRKRINRVIHAGLGSGRLLAGSFLVGVAVTALESVCTGQIYVPTLVLILKNGGGSGPLALGYLLLYNLMFIAPLLAAFALTYRGLTTRRLLQWSRTNVVASKLAMGCFFVAMAALLAAL